MKCGLQRHSYIESSQSGRTSQLKKAWSEQERKRAANRCVPDCACTSISIAWRTVRQTPAVIGCSSRLLQAVGVCFVAETTTIPPGKVPRSFLPEKTFPLNTRRCWTGIEAGAKATWRTESRMIPCWLCAAPARNSGPMSTPTNTCAGFEKAGNEPHLLGYKPLHLSLGGLRAAVAGGGGASRKDVAQG